jgi:hypothetical protein
MYVSNVLVYVLRLVVSISFTNLSNIPPIVYLSYMYVIILHDRKMIFFYIFFLFFFYAYSFIYADTNAIEIFKIKLRKKLLLITATHFLLRDIHILQNTINKNKNSWFMRSLYSIRYIQKVLTYKHVCLWSSFMILCKTWRDLRKSQFSTTTVNFGIQYGCHKLIEILVTSVFGYI